jgi:tRNA nucleotidyltransferase (CCA-adding enzyme)
VTVRPEAPAAVRWIVDRLETAGFETWAVGGAVRDALLGHPSGDWDLATRARPSEVRRIFRRTIPVGIEHGTVGVLARDGVMYEVTTFRRDVETSGRHAVVEFADTVEEDLARRDFTINAIAWHPVRGQILDPFGGAADLDSGVLRTVGNPRARFSEDYLRVLRALRFAGRFHLSIEDETWQALCRAVSGLHVLSRERVREEILKVVSGADRPSAALSLMAASGVLQEIVPELAGAVEEGHCWSLGLLIADQLPPSRPLLRLVAVLRLSDSGEASEEASAGVAAARLLERLRFSRAEVREIGGLVEASEFPTPPPDDPTEVRRWCARVGRARLPDTLRLLAAEARITGVDGFPCPGANAGPERIARLARAARSAAQSGVPLAVGELAVDGRYLIRRGVRPGPAFGKILDHLLDRVLADPSQNQPETLASIAVELSHQEDLGEDEGR